jgi:uncharacterized protein (DUF3084 family)
MKKKKPLKKLSVFQVCELQNRLADFSLEEILNMAKKDTLLGLYEYATQLAEAETQLDLDRHKLRMKAQKAFVDKFLADRIDVGGLMHVDLSNLSPEEFIKKTNELFRKWRSDE